MSTSKGNAEVYFSQTSREFADLYEIRPEFRERYAVWTELLDTYSQGLETALDLGCGNGIFSFYLGRKGLAVTGVDAAVRMIQLCENEKAARGIQGVNFVLAKVPVGASAAVPKRTDLVISSSVLEYVDDLGETLDYVCNSVRPSGIVMVSMPNPRAAFRRMERWLFRIFRRPVYYAYVKHSVSAEVLGEMFAKRGCSHVETRYYVHSPLLSRILRVLRFPSVYTENLFVSVFRKDA